MKPLIILDVDGVILDHTAGFLEYAKSLLTVDAHNALTIAYNNKPIGGLKFEDVLSPEDAKLAKQAISAFNKRDAFADLKPIKGMTNLIGLEKFADFAYVTSCGVEPKTITMRTANVRRCFPDLFSQAWHLPALADKTQTIRNIHRGFEHTMFCDDSAVNIERVTHFQWRKNALILVGHGREEVNTGGVVPLGGYQIPVAHASYELVYFIEKFIRTTPA